ncbi:hypothetical protein [Chondromyces crocatus]|uniref:Glycosyltransferase RgtA/B/C/D-like domain-containing protein n=1 Tax=Chondromyces crocatus TaxID=52 RepID=A0A0K1EJB1_CHOCO|nr:hypothetical protein [Chondromyces crocatus]AKT40767.1 uncharacterized protein CMC5_049230 [Chondromyces crocatus]
MRSAAPATTPPDHDAATLWRGREAQVRALLGPYGSGDLLPGDFRVHRLLSGRDFYEVRIEGPGGAHGALYLAPRGAYPGETIVLPSLGVRLIFDASPADAPSPRPALERLLDIIRSNDDGHFWERPPQEESDTEDRRIEPLDVVVPLGLLLTAALLARRHLAGRHHARAASPRPHQPGGVLSSRFTLAALLLVTVLTAIPLATAETDDAYTVLRYARNLVEHGEFTYNLGERICALTSPLHALLLALLYRLTGELLLPARALGVACTLAAAASLTLSFRRDGTALRCGLALFIASPFVLYWTFGGLETPLLAALLTSSTALAHTSRRAPDGTSTPGLLRQGLPFFLGGLAVITRLDAITFVGPLLVSLAIHPGPTSPSPGRQWAARLLDLVAFAAPPAAWFTFAGSYYGHLLPTSFYVKTPRLDVPWLLANAMYMADFALVSGLLVLPGVAAFLAMSSTSYRAAAHDHLRRFGGIHAGLAGVAAYGLIAATTHLFYAFRLFIPFLGPAALLTADLVAGLRRASTTDEGSTPPRDTSPPTTNTTATPSLTPSSPTAAATSPLDRLFAASTLVLLALQGLSALQVAMPSGNLSGARTGEMRDLGAPDMTAWVRRFAEPADTLRDHWQRQPASAERPMRIATFAVGALAHALPDARVYEQHTAYRHACRPRPGVLASTADYVCVLSPMPEETELDLDRLQLVFETQAELSGTVRHYRVYFNPTPAPQILPPRIDAPCLL